jgi:NADH-quinone oxidoreductase subunit L
MQACLVAIPCIPGVTFLGVAFAWLLGVNPRERLLATVTNLSCLASLLTALGLMIAMAVTGAPSVSVEFGHWFSVGNYHFPLAFFLDWLSAPMVALNVLLTWLVFVFSRRYVHREPGFFRFFALLTLFAFGASLVFAAGSFDLVIGGWELVGITSVLLISFFQERTEPVRNAIRVFATYRGCDVGLLVGVFFLYHASGAATFERLLTGDWPAQVTPLESSTATIAALLLLLASAGKSAQVPFSGWLPRAMEGPTPSSAIFYGAVSVHIGAYLMLRASPLLEKSPIATAAVVITGVLSALHATFVGRACADVKTQLAYASMTQIGLIYVEIGLGFPRLALLHMIGHALVRTLQFLRAPSMLHEYHGMHAASGGHLARTGQHFEALIPAGLRAWMYRLAMDRGHHDTVLDRCLVAPLQALARLVRLFEVPSKAAAVGTNLPLHDTQRNR